MVDAISAPLLSEELTRFANELEFGGLDHFEWTPEGIAVMATMLSASIRMFAIQARTLEEEAALAQSRLAAADCRIEALTIPDYVGRTRHNIAIREGVADGKVIDLRAILADEQDWSAERRAAEATSDGDAA